MSDKVNVIFITKYASFIAPARAGKYLRLLSYLSQYFECTVVSPVEPFVDRKKLESDQVSYLWYYYPGFLLRKLYYVLKKRKKPSARKVKTNKPKKNNPVNLIFKYCSSLSFPDAYFDCGPIAFSITLFKVLTSKGKVVLVAGGYPFTNFFVALLCKKLFANKVRLVLEFRDPFANNPLNKGSGWVPGLRRYFERSLIKESDQVWIYKGWFPAGVSYFKNEYPEYLNKVVELPYAGFDKSIFVDNKVKDKKIIEFLHAGNFYGGDYSPVKFFQAISNVKKSGFTEFKISFYGGLSPDYLKLADSLGISENVEYHGYIPYSSIGEKLQQSSVLLWISGAEISYSDNLPSKVFDYIGANVPIMALLPEGEGFDFAIQNNLEFVALTSDVDAIEQCLYSVVDKFKKFELKANYRDIHKYSYDYLAEVVKDQIEEVVSK
ncbi:hypothetical protein ACMXYN_02825 [Neptuniibacter sp. PT8_73]|uniref:hypothetical protein n=1 Tax=unclassified Neptuniibacter TaxID=2630693 RepID=UPI0039F700FB